MKTKLNLTELINFYTTHSTTSTALHYDISTYKLIKLLKENNVPLHTKQQNTEFTCMERYGVSNPFKDVQHVKESLLKKYNVTNCQYIQSVKNKRKNTCLKKYGIEYAIGSCKVREKIKQTTLERYGVDNPFKDTKLVQKGVMKKYGVEYITQSPIIKEKIKQTFRKKYGVDNPSQSPLLNKDKQMHARKTCLLKHGVVANTLLPQCQFSKGYSVKSKPNMDFAKLLTKNGITYTQEFTLPSKSYDFKVENTLIEVDPSATHNSTWGLFNKEKGLSPRYHFDKTLLANNGGFRCIHIFDWDDKTKIINLLKSRDKINARDCIVKEVSLFDTKNYLMKYHLQNYARDSIRLGLYHGTELVSVMTFGKPRYNKHYEYELIRYCAHKYVVGGAEKLFRYFKNKYQPKSIISYCDNSKFKGDIYVKLGFTLSTYGNPSKHWYNIKTKQHITDNLLRQQGFDRLLGKQCGYYGKGTSNEELMRKHGFVEIYDCGQSVYII